MVQCLEIFVQEVAFLKSKVVYNMHFKTVQLFLMHDYEFIIQIYFL